MTSPSSPTMTKLENEKVTNSSITHDKEEDIRILGVIGGSSLFHAKEFSSGLQALTIDTEYGGVVVYTRMWKNTKLKLVFVQRHHADPDMQYKQPRQINFRAIAAAMQLAKCEAVIGIYSMGSMNVEITVGR
jgi:purine nucleoside phosphorylase